MKLTPLQDRIAITLTTLLIAHAAQATTSGTSLPWDEGISALVSNIEGPIAHAAVIGGLVLAGIIWALTDHGTGVKWLTKLIFGGALAIGVVDAANTLGLEGTLC